MADYSGAYYDMLAPRQRGGNNIMDEAAERRITNNTHISGGGMWSPITTTTGPKVKHTATFESAGETFTVIELRQALAKLNVSADATISFELLDYDGQQNDTTLATVEWTA